MGVPCNCITEKGADMIDFDSARDSMVEHQLAARGIERARVLDAMRYVPRHAFVPEGLRHWAYSDAPLPIGDHQAMCMSSTARSVCLSKHRSTRLLRPQEARMSPMACVARNPTLARSDIERALGDSERRFAHDF
ncbi:MAG TPA: hypothetical protein VL424_12950 [Pararobbsia sp.]|nr:hypothetical protein [Pararobbsia sp.]